MLIPFSSDDKFVAQVVIGLMCGVHSEWQIEDVKKAGLVIFLSIQAIATTLYPPQSIGA